MFRSEIDFMMRSLVLWFYLRLCRLFQATYTLTRQITIIETMIFIYKCAYHLAQSEMENASCIHARKVWGGPIWKLNREMNLCTENGTSHTPTSVNSKWIFAISIHILYGWYRIVVVLWWTKLGLDSFNWAKWYMCMFIVQYWFRIHCLSISNFAEKAKTLLTWMDFMDHLTSAKLVIFNTLCVCAFYSFRLLIESIFTQIFASVDVREWMEGGGGFRGGSVLRTPLIWDRF